jgi:hypothetical protein
MEVFATPYDGYTLHQDRYPYDETRELLKTVSWWWDNDIRQRDTDKVINYTLDSNNISSIEVSLQRRLNRGVFNFVYHGDQIVAYGALRVDDNNQGWSHRYDIVPIHNNKPAGALCSIIIPHHAKQAYDMGLTHFKMSFNDSNYKLYRYFKNGLHRRWNGIKGASKILDSFEYLEKEFILNQYQYVASLDLSRPDIVEILSANEDNTK